MPYPVQRRWQQFLDRDWGWEGTDSLTYRDLLNTQPEQVTLDVILICAYSESTERPIEYFP